MIGNRNGSKNDKNTISKPINTTIKFVVCPADCIIYAYSAYTTPRYARITAHTFVPTLKFCPNAFQNPFHIVPSSFLTILLVMVNKAVTEAPIVITGIQDNIKVRFSAKRSPNRSNALMIGFLVSVPFSIRFIGLFSPVSSSSVSICAAISETVRLSSVSCILSFCKISLIFISLSGSFARSSFYSTIFPHKRLLNKHKKSTYPKVCAFGL